MRGVIVAICGLLWLGACTSTEADTSTTGSPASTITTTVPTPPSSSTIPPTTDVESGCFSDGVDLSSDGFLGRSDSDDTDSQALATVNWTDSGACAAVTLAFRSESGAPAVEPPSIRAVYMRQTAVVRVELGESVTESALSEQALDTDLLKAVYIAYDPSLPGLVADVHLSVGSRVRVRTAESPARVVLEFETDDQLIGPGAIITPDEVVMVPSSTSPPITIFGYGRAASTLDVSLISLAGSMNEALDLVNSPTRWTVFEWTVTDVTPGPVELRIGDAPVIEFLSP